MTGQAGAAAHWDSAYAQGDDTRSWFEEHPGMSLRMLDAAGVSAAAAVIDVGGGASPLTGALLDRGFGDLTVLDISAAGMQHARDRLGSRADQIHWLTADVLSWQPRRHYRAWHDRAVFHFLTIDEHQQQYLHTLDAATARGAVAVFGCFAPDGPQYCSGLPVARYSPAQLARQAGAKWLLISQDREEHITPAGTTQPFTWIALRRQS
ncbi:MAG: class I SAM-dependent methyltransferase [Streptosporangiaceae bacterium]